MCFPTSSLVELDELADSFAEFTQLTSPQANSVYLDSGARLFRAAGSIIILLDASIPGSQQLSAHYHWYVLYGKRTRRDKRVVAWNSSRECGS